MSLPKAAGYPISVPSYCCIEHIGALVVGRAVEPGLQLVLQACLHAVQRVRVPGDLGNREQVRNAGQIFADIVGVVPPPLWLTEK